MHLAELLSLMLDYIDTADDRRNPDGSYRTRDEVVAIQKPIRDKIVGEIEATLRRDGVLPATKVNTVAPAVEELLHAPIDCTNPRKTP